jgi:hypothetical protein
MRDWLTRMAAASPLVLLLLIGVALGCLSHGRELGPPSSPAPGPLDPLRIFRAIYPNDLDYAEGIGLQPTIVRRADGGTALRYLLTNNGGKILRGLHVTIQYLALNQVIHEQDAYFDAVQVKPGRQFAVTVPIACQQSFDTLKHLYRAILTSEISPVTAAQDMGKP